MPTSAVSKKPSAPKNYDGPVYVPAEVYKLLVPEAVIALMKYNSEALNRMANLPLRNMMDLCMSLLRVTNSLSLKQLLPSRNTILKILTKWPKKGNSCH